MKIQEQKWHDFTRVLIVDDCGDGAMGTVQAELYGYIQNEYGVTVYIYGLWVDEPCRRRGVAGRLMDAIEDEARKRGHKVAALHWKVDDTPREILDWYVRRGYEVKETRKEELGEIWWSLLVKRL